MDIEKKAEEYAKKVYPLTPKDSKETIAWVKNQRLLLETGYIAGATDLEEENKRLRDWKESAMEHTPDYHKISKLLNLPLGKSTPDGIVPGIEKLQEKNKRVRDALGSIISQNAGFAEYYMQHNYRAMYELWKDIVTPIAQEALSDK